MATFYGWLLNFFLLVSVIGINAYQLMCLTDLEFDYINPYDSASRINMFVLPEYLVQGFLCAAFLLSGHWFLCLLSLPYLFFNARLYMRKQHLVDVTEIYNQLRLAKKQRLYKFGYLAALFALCIFWLLWTIAEEFD